MSVQEPPPDSRLERAVVILSVLVARKTDFVECALHDFQARVSQSRELSGHGEDIDPIHSKLVEIVARMDWRSFVTGDETERRVLNLATKLEDLDRDAIWSQIQKQIDLD
jgi:hypothetical protein